MIPCLTPRLGHHVGTDRHGISLIVFSKEFTKTNCLKTSTLKTKHTGMKCLIQAKQKGRNLVLSGFAKYDLKKGRKILKN